MKDVPRKTTEWQVSTNGVMTGFRTDDPAKATYEAIRRAPAADQYILHLMRPREGGSFMDRLKEFTDFVDGPSKGLLKVLKHLPCQKLFPRYAKLRELKALRELLANLEHRQWAHWTRYMLDNLTDENIARWKRQIATPYDQLTEKEKDSDREWADKVIALLEDAPFC